jgi:hypothetical protein
VGACIQLASHDVDEPSEVQAFAQRRLVVDELVAPVADEIVQHGGRAGMRRRPDEGPRRPLHVFLLDRAGSIAEESQEEGEVGRRDPHRSAWLEGSKAFVEHRRCPGGRKMLDHVLAEDVVEGCVGEGKPLRRVEPDDARIVRFDVAVQPAGQRMNAATQVQARRPMPCQIALDARPVGGTSLSFLQEHPGAPDQRTGKSEERAHGESNACFARRSGEQDKRSR